MAWDNYVCRYHLTPHGWTTADPAPDDAVWTISERTYQRSGFSRQQELARGAAAFGSHQIVCSPLR